MIDLSFTSNVKQECASLELNECCKQSQLAAFLKLCAVLSIRDNQLNLVIRTENPTVAKRILMLIKQQYQVDSQLSVLKKMKLKKNNIYIIRIFNNVRKILDDTTLYSEHGLVSLPSKELFKRDCCVRSYLAGAFMASGSVNTPSKTNYHLEIASTEEDHAKLIMKLMNKFYLNAKVIKRRNQFVTYIKAADKISDFLNVIGAHNHLHQFEDIRIERDFMNSLKRLENMEVANEMKTQQAANAQIEQILLIRDRLGFKMLNDRIKKVARLRLDYPEASLVELCEYYEAEYDETISKSGLKHRFTKIKEIADRIKDNMSDTSDLRDEEVAEGADEL